MVAVTAPLRPFPYCPPFPLLPSPLSLPAPSSTHSYPHPHTHMHAYPHTHLAECAHHLCCVCAAPPVAWQVVRVRHHFSHRPLRVKSGGGLGDEGAAAVHCIEGREGQEGERGMRGRGAGGEARVHSRGMVNEAQGCRVVMRRSARMRGRGGGSCSQHKGMAAALYLMVSTMPVVASHHTTWRPPSDRSSSPSCSSDKASKAAAKLPATNATNFANCRGCVVRFGQMVRVRKRGDEATISVARVTAAHNAGNLWACPLLPPPPSSIAPPDPTQTRITPPKHVHAHPSHPPA